MTSGNRESIERALTWLLHAQGRSKDGGIPKAFHVLFGWLPSYPETSGYALPTLHACADAFPDLPLRKAADRIGTWLLGLQREDGSFPDSSLEEPLVFDTGQILLGLVEQYERTSDQRYLDASVHAGAFLAGCQAEDGSWIEHSFQGIPHTYYTRTAWGLMRLHQVTGDGASRDHAKAHADWTLGCQRENGWFDHTGFTREGNRAPFSHTIAYTLEGLTRIGQALGESVYVDAATRALDAIVERSLDTGFVAGTFDGTWTGDESFCCLTGSAQLALVAQLLDAGREDKRYTAFVSNVHGYLKKKQKPSGAAKRVRGALAGSAPLWKPYHRLSYPNWAAKFLIDTLWMAEGGAAPTG